MGEVFLSCEEMEMEVNELGKKSREESLSSLLTNGDAMARWDKFLPRMMMRVLLVEADDSTRQIIAALLRKCGYRVAAVSDGLKAWELLKGRPHNVDLILTEVDLPAISGFALLTLIMEHDVCKNIPVIMTSSQDSINTVFKCMMRGAADYLVKPLRRNELSNLWQHVWRRKTSPANGPQDESVAQRKIDDASENDAASNRSNGNTECIQRNDENIDKGSDAQSSCTKPELEVESAPMEIVQECSQPIQGKTSPSNPRMQEDEGLFNLGKKLLVHEVVANGTTVGMFKDVDTEIMLCKSHKPEITRRDANVSSEARETNVVFNYYRDAIDLNGVVNDTPKCNYQNSSSSNGTSKFDYAPTLDLTLRSNSRGFEGHANEKRHLGNSNSSAFTRYINKRLIPVNQSSASGDFEQEKDCGTKAEDHNNIRHCGIDHNLSSEILNPSLSTLKSTLTLATGQSNYSENATYCPQRVLFPQPIPVKGIRISYNPGQESSFLTNTYYQTTLEKSKREHSHDQLSRHANIAPDQAAPTQEQRWDSVEDRGRISPTTDQSTSSSFCNGNPSHFINIGYGSACGSNSNTDQVARTENKNDETYFANTGSSHRSIQREAALNKFRLKRKDRCFEKKVRYESRKKLAEQRPRIKGQFVRQMQPEPPPSATDGDSLRG